MDERPLYVAELKVYDPTVGSERTLYYASRGFPTGRTDTPADTHVDARISKPAVAKRELFAPGTTRGRSRVGYGDLVLINGDGALDALKDYGFDGREIILRRGQVGAAYPAGFRTMLVATMASADVGAEFVTVKLRDQQFILDVPLQPTVYAGDNVLPDGLEGTADDLKGKPKPRCYGRAFNVSPPCVNTAKLIFQVHDGPVAAIPAVYDRGIGLNVTPHGWAKVAHGLTQMSGRSIVTDGSVLVVGGYNAGTNQGLIYTTPDGVVFTSRANPFADESVEGLAFGAGVIVGVGLQRTGAPAASTIATSSDGGASWTSRALPAGWGATEAASIAFVRWMEGPDRFILGTFSGYVATSPDGITWTARTSGLEGLGYWQDAATDGTTIILVGALTAVTPKIAVSVDSGVTWANSPITGIEAATGELSAAVYAHDRWIVANNAGTSDWAHVSTNLVAWDRRQMSFYTGAGGTFALIADNGYLVGAGTIMQVSRDGGDLWEGGERATVNGKNGAAFDVVRFGSQYFATGDDASTSGIWSTPAPVFYADLADLLDDTRAPAPGHYGVHLAGGYFRLGSSPDGIVTADVTEGEAASDRYAGQLLTRLLADPLGTPLAEWSSADVDALDAAAPYELGVWVFATDVTVAQIVDQVAMSVGAYWYSDRDGILRIAQLTAPGGSPVLALVAQDLLQTPERLPTNDQGAGIPTWRSVVRYARNHTVQTTDLAGGVANARRAQLAKEWQEAEFADATVQTRHLLAEQTVEDSLLVTAADALAEATRRQALNGVLRHRYQLVLPLTDETILADLASVLSLTHARFGFAGGLPLRVLDWTPDVSGDVEQLTLTGWR